jgi:adenylate cyclase
MGDGIMAVFGAPLEVDDHADRALGAAREMLEVRLPRFNAWLATSGLRSPDDPFRIGIGLNSGEVMSGTVGSERRVEYAAIGDTTNTAARVEGACKTCGRQLLLTDATLSALLGPPPEVERVSDAPLRGRASSSLVYGLVSDRPTADGPREGTAAAPG